MLGDNAYTTGTDEQYQAAVFDMYPMVLQNTFLWPTVGNHDTGFSREAEHYPYLDIFSLPAAAEAGGVASGTEKYYSFDYANIHFVCLDSMTSDVTPHGMMLTWLQNDLAATTQEWIIAYFHHPPYSKGSHDSDREWELIQMRTNVVPVLEAAGVDLVLCGHSHSYERSYLINGHYGHSSTFTNSMKLNDGDGNRDGAYRKAQGLAANQGAVYSVAGSSGQTTPGPLDHPAMYVGLEVLGSMLIDISSNRLDAHFIDTNSLVLDQFSIVKDGPAPSPPGSAPFGLGVAQLNGNNLSLRWADPATTETGFKIERSTNGTQWTQIGATAANMTNYVDLSVAPETTYHYRVRSFNGAGQSPYSNVATGRMTPQPMLSGARVFSEGGFRVLVYGEAGRRYAIERSTNMTAWSVVTVLTNGTNASIPMYYADSGTNSAPRRFYRARVAP
jgi:hypothetical protein